MRRLAIAFGLVVLLVSVTIGVVDLPIPLRAEETPPPHLGYGVSLRYLENLDPTFANLGFGWIKVYERFGTLPEERLPYRVLYRIDVSLGDRWAWQDGHYRPDLARIRADVRQIALEGRGVVDAYEIGNAPNMDWEWMGQPPDPADYVAVLRVAYEEIKAVDSSAIVVSGGLWPVGRVDGVYSANSGIVYAYHDGSNMDEREYAREMFDRGAGDYFDAFGYHAMGFAYAPEIGLDELPPEDDGNGFTFRGAEEMRAIMLDYGLGNKQMWATQVGWLRDPAEDGMDLCHGNSDFDPVEGYDLPALTQANYLTRAFQYADDNWPWMGVMVVWNLDFHNTGAICWPGRYYSVRMDDGAGEDEPTPGLSTPAYDALVTMEKRPGFFGSRLFLPLVFRVG